jgi:hypothetical protein
MNEVNHELNVTTNMKAFLVPLHVLDQRTQKQQVPLLLCALGDHMADERGSEKRKRKREYQRTIRFLAKARISEKDQPARTRARKRRKVQQIVSFTNCIVRISDMQ